jgi:hypothetical protein
MAIPRPHVIAGGMVGIVIVILAVLVLRPVLSAISVRDDVAKIRRGHFDEKQLRQWAARHGGDVWCENGECHGDVDISNRLLHALHLAPLTRFGADVVIVSNQPVQSSLILHDMGSLHRAAGGTTFVEMVYEPDKTRFPVCDWEVRRGPTSKPPSRRYIVAPQSSPQAINRAFDINVWCLARIEGCSGPQQAPDIWALPLSGYATN